MLSIRVFILIGGSPKLDFVKFKSMGRAIKMEKTARIVQAWQKRIDFLPA